MFRGAFIDNHFKNSTKGTTWTNQNPFDLKAPLFDWVEDPDLVDQAIASSREAFGKWREKGEQDKIKYFKSLSQAFDRRIPELTEAIVKESGKAHWEAKAEAKALSAKVHITIEEALPLLHQIENTGYVEDKSGMRFLPRGVCAVIGPFNFPLHLSNGHIIPALLTGNTVILKPSEHCPWSAMIYAEAFLEAGFPSGVFQMLPGGIETGQRLVKHPDIRGIFFTGSYQNGKRIQQTLLDSREDLATALALEMGGKNASIIHHDANLKNALTESLVSAFATTGQRCSCSSRLLVHRKVYDEFRERFVELTKELSVGDPSLEETFMGPMIHEEALHSFLSHLETAKNEGFRPLVDSKRISEGSCLVTPSVYEVADPLGKSNSLFTEEVFGPNTILCAYETAEDAIELHEAAPFGLVASVFTEDRHFLDQMDQGLQVGLLNCNRGTVGANSRLPFGGTKRSGNNWPAGLFSFFYCVNPRSYLFEKNEFEASRIPEPLKATLRSKLDA